MKLPPFKEDDTLPAQPAMRAYAQLVGRERMRQELLDCGCPASDVDRIVEALFAESTTEDT